MHTHSTLTSFRWSLSLGAAAALAATAGCDISVSEEDQLGDRYAAEVVGQVRLMDQPDVVEYVTRLGMRIVPEDERAQRDWHFYVVNDTLVNAFAIPGGHIFVNRGLIERAGNYAELAGVLGHEVAHVTLRHSVEQIKSRQKANVVVTVFCSIISVCGSPVAQVAIGVGGQLLFAKYSREDEAEADSAAVGFLVQSGIDPRGVPSMFRRLLEERARDPIRLDAWLGSHPLEETRIARTETLVASFATSEPSTPVENDAGFQDFRARVQALPR